MSVMFCVQKYVQTMQRNELRPYRTVNALVMFARGILVLFKRSAENIFMDEFIKKQGGATNRREKNPATRQRSGPQDETGTREYSAEAADNDEFPVQGRLE
eukprot:4809961-Amphidinium_carterae.1